LNLYAFCMNNGVNSWDLLGMDPPANPATSGYIIAGGSATKPLGVVGHYFSGTISPSGEIRVLDFGANQLSGGIANPGALVYSSDTHANVLTFPNQTAFSAWTTRNSYTAYATYASGSQLDSANYTIDSFAANPGNYSGLQVAGNSCVSANCAVEASAGIQTPAETAYQSWVDYGSGSDLPAAVINGATALYYTSQTPGFVP